MEQLLGPTPLATFTEQYYLRLPFSSAGGCQTLCRLANWDTIDRLLAAPGVDVLVGQKGKRWRGPVPKSTAEARTALAAGNTLGIRHAEKHDAGLAGLAAAFREDFAAPVDVHLYCAPAGHAGLGWHYDAEEVFILQTHGAKEWRLRKNTVHPWPLVETLPGDMCYEREIMPMQTCTLQAGDWLYVPSGYWHSTRAVEESVSISVGVLPAVAIDVYDFLRERLRSSLKWRQRLPASGKASPLTAEEQAQRYRQLFSDLGADLADLFSQEDLARDFLNHRTSPGASGGRQPADRPHPGDSCPA